VPAFMAAYAANIEDRGRVVAPRASRPELMGSTDMGNVSQVVPSIHPMIQVAPTGVPIHTPDFATHTRGPEADRAVIDGAVAMARTIVDLWTDDGLLDAVRSDFDAAKRGG
jgi:metal-dependent amidase/aminoacylase/carboxypeptidase family protein